MVERASKGREREQEKDREGVREKQVVLSVPQGPKSYICIELQILKKRDNRDRKSVV